VVQCSVVACSSCSEVTRPPYLTHVCLIYQRTFFDVCQPTFSTHALAIWLRGYGKFKVIIDRSPISCKI